MKFQIYRYDPEKDSKPYTQDYDVVLEPTDRMLLDALMRLKAQDIEKSGKQDVLNYCMGCHTITTIVHPCRSHYLLDKVLWALGDDAPSSLSVPKSVTRKAAAKLMSNGRTLLPMV